MKEIEQKPMAIVTIVESLLPYFNKLSLDEAATLVRGVSAANGKVIDTFTGKSLRRHLETIGGQYVSIRKNIIYVSQMDAWSQVHTTEMNVHSYLTRVHNKPVESPTGQAKRVAQSEVETATLRFGTRSAGNAEIRD